MFDAETLDTILWLTPGIICCAFVLVVSGMIAPKTKGKTDQ